MCEHADWAGCGYCEAEPLRAEVERLESLWTVTTLRRMVAEREAEIERLRGLLKELFEPARELDGTIVEGVNIAAYPSSLEFYGNCDPVEWLERVRAALGEEE